MSTTVIQEVALSKIQQNENSRMAYKTADMSELMISMKQEGLLQPVGVRSLGGGEYEAIFGNRRIISATKLGWKTIPAVILGDVTDVGLLIKNFHENAHRRNTSVEEDGRLFRVFQDEYQLTPAEIAARTNVSLHRVRLALDALDIVPAEHLNRITARRGPRKRNALSPSVAIGLIHVAKERKLSKVQTGELFTAATEGKFTTNQTQAFARAMSRGESLDDAIKNAQTERCISLTVVMSKKEIARLEAKERKKISGILVDYLARSTEMKIKKLQTARVFKYRSTSDPLRRQNARERNARVQD